MLGFHLVAIFRITSRCASVDDHLRCVHRSASMGGSRSGRDASARQFFPRGVLGVEHKRVARDRILVGVSYCSSKQHQLVPPHYSVLPRVPATIVCPNRAVKASPAVSTFWTIGNIALLYKSIFNCCFILDESAIGPTFTVQ